MIRGMIMMNLPSVTDVYDFWFNELEAQDHFTKNPSLDTKIKDRFEPLWQAAKNQAVRILGIVMVQMPKDRREVPLDLVVHRWI